MPTQYTPVQKALDRVFGYTWARLVEEGWCETGGSVENLRIHDEWVRDGRPLPIHRYIMTRANRPPR